jgi:hypothetical protein
LGLLKKSAYATSGINQRMLLEKHIKLFIRRKICE